jgi:hypothetical protein
LNLKVRLPFPESLELGTGETPNEREMHLTIRETAPEFRKSIAERTKGVKDSLKSKDDLPFGMMIYSPEWADSDGLHSGPASIFFEVYAPAEVMASLVRFAENGLFPKRVQLEVRGLHYGYGGDGREKRWPDNKDTSMLPIVNMDYDLPLKDEPEDLLPGEPTTPVGADLAPILQETLKWLKGGVLLLAAIAGAVVFANWR